MSSDETATLIASLNLLNAAICALFDTHPDKAALRAAFMQSSEPVMTHHLFRDRSEQARAQLDQTRDAFLSRLAN